MRTGLSVSGACPLLTDNGTLADMSDKRLSGGDRLVEQCLQGIRTLFPGDQVQYVPSGDSEGHDGELRLELASRRAARYRVTEKRTHLSYGLVDGLPVGTSGTKATNLLFAPYVAPPMGRYLVERQWNYVDAVGNLHLTLGAGGSTVAHVEGRTPRREVATRGTRLPGHLVTLALLADRNLLAAPVRTLAAMAGVSKTAVADQLQRLTEQGLLARTKNGLQLLRGGTLLERWIGAYLDTVRPRWLLGRFQTQESDVERLERSLSERLAGMTWGLGGGAAAWRLIRHYRGEETVLHVAAAPADLAGRLRALPSQSGNLVVLVAAVPLVFEGSAPNLVHPLLVYSELLASQDPRAREAAGEFRRQQLPELA